MKIKSINPYTEELLEEFELLTENQLHVEIKKSREAFLKWRNVEISEKTKLVQNLAMELRKEQRRYAATITREMGKSITESMAEVEKCAKLCEYYAENAEAFLKTEYIQTGEKQCYVTFEPLGIVLAIMPWNFPFWQVFRCAVPAIVSGNACVLKHASNVPRSALEIESIFINAGFPHNIFKTLLIDAGSAIKLIDEDKVDAVSLTGSNKAGEQIGAIAGKRIKPIVLELGGSDPFIVLKDADIDRAAENAARARMLNVGQSCVAAKRFIVIEAVAGQFISKFTEHFRSLKMGDPMDENTTVCPLARRDFVEELEGLLNDARLKGGKIVFPDEPKPQKGFFFTPCIVTNATRDMRIVREEVFGPIAPVLRVANEEEAVLVANDTEYGLGACIWSKDVDKAQRLAARIQSGIVAINDMVKSDPRMPFGGIKKSGIGRELSHYGIKAFVNIKTVVVKN
ncbi:NAD-dependent succinate-semialdehyde dehydrogenase [Candidatus Kuenenia sp.]|uniref:NAD-dependent succinate-semialdehyde dehydrogenase n=1 Tax=Candidatus Kuenenia sp. TaxID=2499824 RepID=UPI00321F7B13